MNSSPGFDVDRHFYMVSLSTTRLTPSGDANFFDQSLTGRGPPSSLHWRNSGTGNGREDVYLVVIGMLCPPRVVVRCFRIPLWRKVQRHTICSDSIQSLSAKYLLWKTRTSWSKRVPSFLFRLPSFSTAPFYAVTYRTICEAAFDPSSTFFLFLQNLLFVTFRTFFWCCRS